MARTKRTVRAESETTSGITVILRDSGDPRDTARFTVTMHHPTNGTDTLAATQNESRAWITFDAAVQTIDHLEGN